MSLSAPPFKISFKIDLSRSFTGKQTIFRARRGFAPTAYISLNALATAICPKS